MGRCVQSVNDVPPSADAALGAQDLALGMRTEAAECRDQHPVDCEFWSAMRLFLADALYVNYLSDVEEADVLRSSRISSLS